MDNVAGKKLWSKDYIFLLISNFFLFFGDSLLLPVLPVYMKDNGANDIQVGVITAVFFGTSILMRMFTSRASARLGKKTLLILTLSVFALAMLGYRLFASLFVIFLLRMIQGIGFGASTTLYSTMTASIIPNERMGEGMSYFGLGITVAIALGPCLGATAVTFSNYRWVFWVGVLLELIAILLSFTIQTENCRSPVAPKNGIQDLLRDIIEPKVFYEAVFMLLIGLSMGGLCTYGVLFAKEINITNVSMYFVIASLAEFLVRLFAGKLYDRKGMNIVVAPGAIAGMISCVVMANAVDLTMVCISAFFCGIAYGMIFPVMEASAMTHAAPERRIAANATLYNFLDIGTGLGSLLFGILARLSGYAHAFLLSSLIFAVMLFLLAFTSYSE